MFFVRNKKFKNTELYAISNALQITIQETSNISNTFIIIFCDLQKTSQIIQHPLSHIKNRFLGERIYHKAKSLHGTRHFLVCQCTSSYFKLKENKKNNLTAKSSADKGGKKAKH